MRKYYKKEAGYYQPALMLITEQNSFAPYVHQFNQLFIYFRM